MHRALSRVALVAGLWILPCTVAAQADSTSSTRHLVDSGSELPRPFAKFNESARSLRDSIVALARAQIGKRYVYGGESPSSGFDCSGLVQYIAAALHIRLPRTARQQAHVGRSIPPDTSQLLPGDLLTFGNGRTITHVGIYVGDGRMVHASTAAGKVIETKLLRPPARGIKPWRGARRLVGDGGEREQRAESREQKAVIRGRKQKAESSEKETGNREQETGTAHLSTSSPRLSLSSPRKRGPMFWLCSMDPRLRGDDAWIVPAFAGMTTFRGDDSMGVQFLFPVSCFLFP